MARQLEVRFKIAAWDETVISEVEGMGQLSRASVKRKFAGDLEGEGVLEYLMSYNSDGTARFIGYERVTGRMGEREGTFVLQHEGIFEDGVARSDVKIVEGSGTGDLASIAGEGSYAADQSDEHVMEIRLRF